ncbi:transglutaminase superfamily protein [Paenibacillus taihuensis]|uniref:Transglutaminase superfamily protein n=1 Tax=Paenibacillus taihuensis TaxID=1156355 RepID=A0A3D9SEU3_9BACL|nr:transglutaminase-like domain-containing protein [Paenibacillus taihuensis]REE93107.1 transglutaminase superfamily protein [Paenibacillus taihuensis]
MTAISRAAFKWLSADVYRKLSAVLSALLIYEWIRCLGDYWWEETFTIVNGVLFAVVVTSLLIPSKIWSGTIQLLILVLLNAVYSGYEWIPFAGEKRKLLDWMDWLGMQLDQLQPYIWISLGIWAAFHVIVLMRHKRLLIMAVVLAAILTLATADSLFTPIHLWQEIAWSVFIGLGWLVASHFASFQKRHPENWSQLLEYPLSLFLPMLIIITLVMGAGLFVPAIHPVITDPYTAWKEARNETVPSFIGDKAITIPASKTSAGSQSGYSRSDASLGGGFEFDYSPVMTVTTSQKAYWRGETRSYYNGSGWLEAVPEKLEKGNGPVASGQQFKALYTEATTETELVEQTVQMVSKTKYPVLFGAGPIASVVSVDGKANLPGLSWFSQAWELRLMKFGSATYPKKYTIKSNVPVLDEEKLRGEVASQKSTDIDPMYMELPPTIPERVKTLAQEITKTGATPYDKMQLLVAYLQKTYTYTNTPDVSKRVSEDFVDSFLFEVREGYCDYFSTALAVMAREIGIPSRWVKGYSPGSLPVDPEIQRQQGYTSIEVNPSGSGTYTVRNADAHSWVEIYFNGYGWLPFEATSGFSYPYAMPKDKTAPEPVPAPVIEPDTITETAAPAGSQLQPWIIWTAASVAAALILLFIILRFRVVQGIRQWLDGRSGTVNERIVRETNRLIRFCRKKGLDYNETDTVRETMGRWSARLSSLQPQFREVQYAFEKAMYSSSQVSQAELDQVTLTMKKIREHLG